MVPKNQFDADGNLKMRRPRRSTAQSIKTNNIELEKVFGITSLKNPSLTLHPQKDIMAYPAGCTTVLYDWKKNQQGPFLVAKNDASHLENNVSSLVSNQLSSFGVQSPGGISPMYINSNLGVATSRNLTNQPKTVVSTAFSNDGRYLAVGETGYNPRVLIWDLELGKYISELKGHKFGILAIAFSPELKYLISLGYQHDGVLNIWSWRQGSILASNRITAKVSSLAMSPNGDFCVTSGLRHVKFWYFKDNNSAGHSTQVVEGRAGILGIFKTSNFIDITCTKDNALCYAITSDGFLCSFSSNRKVDKYIDLKVKSALSISYNNGMLICGCSGGIVRIFDSSNLKHLGTLPKPHPLGLDLDAYKGNGYIANQDPNNIFPDALIVKLNMNGTKAVVIYSDRSYYIWELSDLKKVRKYCNALYHCDAIWGNELINTDQGQKMFTCSTDGTARVWNIEPDTNQENILSKDLSKILYIEKDSILKYQHPEIQPNEKLKDNSNQMKPYDAHLGIRCLKLTSDGNYLITGDRNGNLRIHDMKSYKIINYQEAHDAEIMDLDVLTMIDDDNVYYYIASASRDRLIHVFSMSQTSFKLIQTLDDHSASITSVKFFDHGNCLVSCGADKSLIFRGSIEKFGLPYYTQYSKYCGKAALYSMAADHFNNTVTVVTQDKKIIQFNVKNGKLINSIKPGCGEDISISRISLDASGLFACIGGPDKTVRLFDLVAGQFIGSGIGHSEMITSVKFSSDCNQVISTSSDGCIYIWKVLPGLASQMRNKLTKVIRPLYNKEFAPSSPINDSKLKENNGSNLSKIRASSRPRSNSIDPIALHNSAKPDIKWSQKINDKGISVFNSNSNSKPVLATPNKTDYNSELIKPPHSPYDHLAKLSDKIQSNNVQLNSNNNNSNENSIDEIINGFNTVDETFDIQNDMAFYIAQNEAENETNSTNSPISDKELNNDEYLEVISGHEDIQGLQNNESALDKSLEDDPDQPFIPLASSSLPTHRRSLSSRFLALQPSQISQRINKVSSINPSSETTPSTFTSFPRFKDGVEKVMDSNTRIKRTSSLLKRLRRSRSSAMFPAPAQLTIKVPENNKANLNPNQLGIRHLLTSPTTPRPLSSNLYNLTTLSQVNNQTYINELNNFDTKELQTMDEVSSTRQKVNNMKDEVWAKLKKQSTDSIHIQVTLDKEQTIKQGLLEENGDLENHRFINKAVDEDINQVTEILNRICTQFKDLKDRDSKSCLRNKLILLRGMLLDILPLETEPETSFEMKKIELLEEYSKLLIKKVEQKLDYKKN